MSNIASILNQVEHLSQAELKQVSARLLELLKGTSNATATNHSSVAACRKCDSERIVKFGRDKNGKQRYKCKDCGATFTETSFSVVSKTHKSEETWDKYIGLLLSGASLEACAWRCHISLRTAFIWRHKILNALQNDQGNRMLAGIIEADEMFLPVSYKGNHKKSKRFTMPRAPFKRGSDNHAHQFPKACIMCAVERDGQSYGEVLGQGQPTVKMITHAFKQRIASESIMLSDGALAMKSYFKKRKDVELVRLKASFAANRCGGPPEIRGPYHVQHVNNFHNRLQRFLRCYNGVSTKYLNHYVSLFVWLENHKKIDNVDIYKAVETDIAGTGTYRKAEDLFSFPPVPSVA